MQQSHALVTDNQGDIIIAKSTLHTQ